MAGSSGGDAAEYRSVLIDIHGTSTRADHAPDLGSPQPGFIAAMRAFDKAGMLIYLSCGGFRGEDAPDFMEKVKGWLRKYGLEPDNMRIIMRPAPKVAAIVDDRALRFSGSNWPEIQAEVLKRVNSDPSKPPASNCDCGCCAH